MSALFSDFAMDDKERNLHVVGAFKEMNLIMKRVFLSLALAACLISCQSDDYAAPSRAPLTLEPLEVATNIAPPSSEYDVYDIDFTKFSQRYLDVTMSLECPSPCHLKMATWTPGSYLIREYARNMPDDPCYVS